MSDLKQLFNFLIKKNLFSYAQKVEDLDSLYKEKLEPEFDSKDEFAEIKRKIFDSNNIMLSSQGGSEVLGMGGFGTVYSGIYEGKPVAVKLMLPQKDFGQDEEDEASIWSFDNQVWEEILEITPEKYKKYIPKIYLTNEDHIDDIHYKIIVMEQLVPLHKTVADIYENGDEAGDIEPFPTEAFEASRTKKKIYEGFRGFYTYLKFLERNGISWVDLSSENVMMGRHDNELKLADVGLFEI